VRKLVMILTILGALVAAGGASAATIAFSRGTATTPVSVWIAAADGSGARQLGNGYSPLIAPNGATVAAVAISGNSIVLYPTGAGKPRTIAFRAPVQPADWSPDSRYLAVVVSDDATRGLGHAGLAVLDTQTGRVRAIKRGIIEGASFAPSGPDRVVFGSAPSQLLRAPVNLYEAKANGGRVAQLTHDGRSLNPAWGARGIAYDRQTQRSEAPAWQVMLRRGSRTTQLTHLRIGPLVDGLAPVQFSADGNRLLCEYLGQDTDNAWTIQLSPLKVSQVKVPGQNVTGGAISRDGNSLLITIGAFMDPPSTGTVETIPFGGGAATPLVRGASASWDL
jgi:hypothetical protein